MLNMTSVLYSLLGLEMNSEKCFAVELDPERDRTKYLPETGGTIHQHADRAG